MYYIPGTNFKKKKKRPEIEPHIYGQLIFNKGTKAIQWRKNVLFNKRYWKNLIPAKKSELQFITYVIYKINSKWNIDLKVKPTIIKLPEENIEKIS